MHNPAHPGEIFKDQVLEPLGISVSDAADMLRVQRSELQDIIDCKAPVGPELAVKFEKSFGQPAELWLRLQVAHDLWQVRQKMTDCIIPNV